MVILKRLNGSHFGLFLLADMFVSESKDRTQGNLAPIPVYDIILLVVGF
jgi:hypothetical protein